MEIDFKNELNESQYLACSSPAHHLRIVAGAGTGKTRVLTYRIAYLITQFNVAPNRIVAITFTNKVAKEMQERVAKLLAKTGLEGNFKPLIVTFHGYCYRFLRREITHIEGFNTQFTVSDDEDQKTVWKRVFAELDLGDDKDRKKYVIGQIDRVKSLGLFPEEVGEELFPAYGIVRAPEIKRAYRLYQGILKKSNALDFDDLLMFTLKILQEFPEVRKKWQAKFDAYLVDEFQDTNELQYKLVNLLMPTNGALTVVGDPDQTIYTWRGADNDIITKNLPRDYKDLQTITLDVNYRSTQSILDKANLLIKNNLARVDKSLVAFSGEKGSEVSYTYCFSQDNEASVVVNNILTLKSQGSHYSDVAIIYRSNYLSSAFEKALTQNRIPYAVYGGQKFYERREVKDALAYLRLLVNPKDDFSFLRIIKAPTIGIGEVTLEQLRHLAAQQDASLFELIHDHLAALALKPGIIGYLVALTTAYNTCLKDLQTVDGGTEYSTILFKYLEQVHYLEYVQKIDSKEDKDRLDTNDKETRLKNVRELLGQVGKYIDDEHFDEQGEPMQSTLADFLIDVAIQSDQDTMESADKLLLMTAHVSKGLEFPYVFVVGLNNSVFPTSHALDEGTKALEEERRLLYVSMTRAKKGLYLSSFGGYSFTTGNPQEPSMFLPEIGFKPVKRENPFASHDNYQRFSGSKTKVYNDKSPYRPLEGFASETMRQADQLMNLRQRGGANKPVMAENYAVGDKVAHVSFGLGVVTDIDKATITVSFKEPYGVKKLIKGFKAYKKVVD